MDDKSLLLSLESVIVDSYLRYKKSFSDTKRSNKNP